MESPTQSSFIPQDTVTPSRSINTSGLPELLLLLSVLVLVVSGGLAGAVFVYQQYLHSSVQSKTEQLNRAQSAFQPSLIVQLERLDERMSSAETLLHNHVAASTIFKALEDSTNKNIRFTSYSFDAADASHVTVRMNGIAASVNSIALQADLFAKNGAFSDPIFSGIGREQGGVHFDFTATVNPAFIKYAQSSSSADASSQAQGVPQTVPSNQSVSPFTSGPQQSASTSSKSTQ